MGTGPAEPPRSRGHSRSTSRQPSMTGNSQYPVPQYNNQYNNAPAPVQEPNRNEHYAPHQGYGTSDVAGQAQGHNPGYSQPGFDSGKTGSAIQLGAYPQGTAAVNPSYGMPNPAGYGQPPQHPEYPAVRYGGPNQQQQHGPLGQGAQQPHSHVQYPGVLYDQQHQNYAQHDPHTMVRWLPSLPLTKCSLRNA